MWPFTSSSSFTAVVQSKQEERGQALIKALASSSAAHGTADSAVYLAASASTIVDHIASGQWTASEVLEAYIARAVLAQSTTNCLTEVFFQEARKDAQLLDKEFAITGKLKGPLHGVPVSFKDNYDIIGHDSTMGFTSRAHLPAQKDAEIVALVRKAGGIPFVKTNIPQTMMFFECINPLWGRTTNPFSPEHTSGGSSGGEAALLRMDGSALGWGTDIGGSIRIPTGYCGVYGLKFSFGRASTVGAHSTMPGFETIQAVTGPLARTVDDIELAARLVVGQAGSGYHPAPVPYRQVELPSKLKFGYYTSDNFIKASPACKRAVQESVAALRAAGHECVEITIPDPKTTMGIFLAASGADGFKTLTSEIGQDPTQSELTVTLSGPNLWGWLRNIVKWIVGGVLNDPIVAHIVDSQRRRPVNEFFKVTMEKEAYAATFQEQIWERHKLDGIICPISALPALPHGAVTYVAALSCATIVYNVVESPVGSVPVTRVDPDLDVVTEEWSDPSVGSGHGSHLMEGLLYKGKTPFYDAKKMAGLPVGVQVVGKKWEDEKVVEMMKVLDRALGKRGFEPGSWKAPQNLKA
ncbi:amidase signature enzyme [Cristinia sonorae]|uniref:amidase n=1 Tax=Cristinia sonorae TaxID=1940300 RepID=A0A8K0UJT0_9AGAR|nr:amidase signature enzyme [Cristinia sonorae]